MGRRPDKEQEEPPKGWICPVCGTGVAPTILFHCSNTTKFTPAVAIWCPNCRAYVVSGHSCNGTGIYPTSPYWYSTTWSGTDVNPPETPKD